MARRLKPRAVVHQQKMTAGQMLFSFVPRNEPETVLHPSRLHALSVRGLIRACFRDNALFFFLSVFCYADQSGKHDIIRLFEYIF